MLQKTPRRRTLVKIRDTIDAPLESDVGDLLLYLGMDFLAHITLGSSNSRTTVRRHLASLQILDGLPRITRDDLILGLQKLICILVD